MRYFFALTVTVLMSTAAFAQEISQKISGRVAHAYSLLPIEGVNVLIVQGDKQFQAQTDNKGLFTMEAPVGRYRLVATFTGFNPANEELLVVAGKASVIDITLTPSRTELQTVEVTAPATAEEFPGAYSLSIEKTLRIPANYLDPVRAITAYPGVMATNDQNNSIIVRGNSPNGLLWRVNGVDVVNPNHLANAGTLSDRPASNGGGVNILSAQMLGNTSFYTGAIPTAYGNATSGVIDFTLREGQPRRAFTAQASLIGLDVTAEGALRKGGNSTYLVNYRYSTVGLLSGLGLDFGGEAIGFQDLSFQIAIPSSRGGKLKVFGFWGDSRNEFNAPEEAEREEQKDNFNIDFKGNTVTAGLNYTVPLAKGTLMMASAFSSSDQSRASTPAANAPNNIFWVLNEDMEAKNQLISNHVRYQRTLGSGALELGMIANAYQMELESMQYVGCQTCLTDRQINYDGSFSGMLFQPYTNVMLNLSDKLNLDAGVRFVYDSRNDASGVEPRTKLTYQYSPQSSWSFSYGLVSQQQQIQILSAEGNEDLGFTKSHRLDLQFARTFVNSWQLRTGLFYQQLFDVPVERIPSAFSALNVLEDFAPANLVQEGKGKNYGWDFTLEKSFYSNQFVVVGGSVYDSKTTGSDNVERDSRFNGRFTFSAVYGKEWTKTAKNRTISANTRVLYLGGMREPGIDEAQSVLAGETVYGNTFTNQLGDYTRIDFRIAFRKNKPGYTRTFAIDIQNLLGIENDGLMYYDFFQAKPVRRYQLGVIPILVYRIEF